MRLGIGFWKTVGNVDAGAVLRRRPMTRRDVLVNCMTSEIVSHDSCRPGCCAS